MENQENRNNVNAYFNWNRWHGRMKMYQVPTRKIQKKPPDGTKLVELSELVAERHGGPASR